MNPQQEQQPKMEDAIYTFVNKTANKDAGVFRNGLKLGFIAGANWQKEHSYSEQEVISMLEALRQRCAEEIKLGDTVLQLQNKIRKVEYKDLIK